MDSAIFATYLLKGYKTDWLLGYERLARWLKGCFRSVLMNWKNVRIGKDIHIEISFHCDGLGFLWLHKLWDSFPSILFNQHAYCEIRISCLTNTFIPDFKQGILILNCWTCSLVNSEVCKLLYIANSHTFPLMLHYRLVPTGTTVSGWVRVLYCLHTNRGQTNAPMN